jgi:hypothetical protein
MTLVKTRRILIATSGGHPIFRVLPRILIETYDPYWGLWGFSVYWLGIETLFCFGEDRNGLYSRRWK